MYNLSIFLTINYLETEKKNRSVYNMIRLIIQRPSYC